MATDNVGVELLAATPFRHRVGLGPTGILPTVHHLPPTLMAQWYFGEFQQQGAPLYWCRRHVTTFFDEKFNDTGKEAGLFHRA
ncbi:OmpW family outer membrane protein [Enterobacter hormaechei]